MISDGWDIYHVRPTRVKAFRVDHVKGYKTCGKSGVYLIPRLLMYDGQSYPYIIGHKNEKVLSCPDREDLLKIVDS